MSDLERRAEELKKELCEERGYTDGAALAALNLIEQLLSENRQVPMLKEALERQDLGPEIDSLTTRAEAAEARVREFELDPNLSCGGRGIVIGTGCGRGFDSIAEIYRCASCDQPFHKTCLVDEHFSQSWQSVLPHEREQIVSLRQDLERISAEREAYREDAERWRWLLDHLPDGFDGDGSTECIIADALEDHARRILAENPIIIIKDDGLYDRLAENEGTSRKADSSPSGEVPEDDKEPNR